APLGELGRVVNPSVARSGRYWVSRRLAEYLRAAGRADSDWGRVHPGEICQVRLARSPRVAASVPQQVARPRLVSVDRAGPPSPVVVGFLLAVRRWAFDLDLAVFHPAASVHRRLAGS